MMYRAHFIQKENITILTVAIGPIVKLNWACNHIND